MAAPPAPLKMYNLNVNVATSLGAGGIFENHTPRTPEILNSLIAMTNPFDNLCKTAASPKSDSGRSLAASPSGSQTMSPPSVQHTCSQLIKEGLKLTLQSKRKISGSESKDESDDIPLKRLKSEELTVEDEDRRRRRRERNKIAATKCRLKKREKTAHLVTESEVLETQNAEMKVQIKDLERQRRNLEEMLNNHACAKRNGSAAVPPAYNYPPQVQPSYVDPDFGEDTALISYNKDPNFGKLMESFFPPEHGKRGKEDGEVRAGAANNFYCEEDDMYRPNGTLPMDNYFTHDSGYASFNGSSLDPGCRA